MNVPGQCIRQARDEGLEAVNELTMTSQGLGTTERKTLAPNRMQQRGAHAGQVVPEVRENKPHVGRATTNHLAPLVCFSDVGTAEGAIGKCGGLGWAVINQSTKNTAAVKPRKWTAEGLASSHRRSLNHLKIGVLHTTCGSTVNLRSRRSESSRTTLRSVFPWTSDIRVTGLCFSLLASLFSTLIEHSTTHPQIQSLGLSEPGSVHANWKFEATTKQDCVASRNDLLSKCEALLWKSRL